MRSLSIKKVFFYLSVLFVLILAFLLRAQESLSGNFLFLIDQGRDMMAVKQIAYDHHLTLIGPYTSLQGIFQGPLWYYLLAVPTIIFNGNPRGSVILMLVISMGVIVVSFLWMKKLFGEKTALITAFIIALCPEAIAAATYSWNPHPMWILLCVYLFCFYNLILGNKKYHLFVWPLISLMFHFETALAFFILLASIFYILIFGRKLVFSKFTVYGFLLFTLFFLPQILFDVRHNFLMTKSFFKLFQGHDQGLFVNGERTSYINLLNGHLYTFFINFNSIFQKSSDISNIPKLVFLGSMIFLVSNFLKRCFTQKEYTFIFFHLILIAFVFIFTSLYPFPVRYWFLTGFQMFYILPLGFILGKLFNRFPGKALLILFMLVNLHTVIPQIQKLYINPNLGGIAKIQGKLDAIDEIYADAQHKSFNLLVFTPPVNTDAYDYLLWWKGKQKYHYVPRGEKKDTFYLLIEPDPEKPWSYKGWLATVIKEGEIIYTKQLGSGFIIQKRILKS